MDWEAIGKALAALVIGVPPLLYAQNRWFKRTHAADKAEKYAADWLQEVIKRQDADIELMRKSHREQMREAEERIAEMRRSLLEVGRKQESFQKAASSDIKRLWTVTPETGGHLDQGPATGIFTGDG